MRTSTTEEEEIVGTIEVNCRHSLGGDASSPYISNLAVSPIYRRQGIGQKLLRKCEQIALDWGCSQLSLHVLEDNHSARQLYTNSGYQVHQVELNLGRWLLGRPRRLLLKKTF
jgi:ribosomal protein S18 acetylase RimI-like enzyme